MISVFLVYWILGWLNFALWIQWLAYDMPLEGYLLRKFGYDMAIAGVYWTALYYSALFLSKIVS